MNIKKTLISIAAVVLAFSSTASAIFVPQPKNNLEAYAFAKEFYNDGYYYEAKYELEKVDPTADFYEPAKQAAWMASVNAKIAQYEYEMDRVKVKNILAAAKKLNSELKFTEALAVLHEANNIAITVTEYESLKWWHEAVCKNLGSLKYAPVNSNFAAIKAVKADGWVPVTADESYYAAEMLPGYWHVYVLTRTPEGVKKDVAAFEVWADGSVNRKF